MGSWLHEHYEYDETGRDAVPLDDDVRVGIEEFIAELPKCGDMQSLERDVDSFVSSEEVTPLVQKAVAAPDSDKQDATLATMTVAAALWYIAQTLLKIDYETDSLTKSRKLKVRVRKGKASPESLGNCLKWILNLKQ